MCIEMGMREVVNVNMRESRSLEQISIDRVFGEDDSGEEFVGWIFQFWWDGYMFIGYQLFVEVIEGQKVDELECGQLGVGQEVDGYS